MATAPSLFAVQNQLPYELLLTNYESRADDRALPSGLTYTFGQFEGGCAIPDCSGPNEWEGHRMVIQGGSFCMNLFKKPGADGAICYLMGQGGYPPNPAPVPVNTKNRPVGKVKLTIAADETVMIEAYTPGFNPQDDIKLIGLVNNLDFNVDFVNGENASENVLNIAAKSSTPLPGQDQAGCNVPVCGNQKEWHARMQVRDSATGGDQFTLNLCQMSADIFHTFGTGGFPENKSDRRPLPGGFSQGDGWRKVLILNGTNDVQMQDRQDMEIKIHQILPRNIAWVHDMPPALTKADIPDIAWSRFSHIIVSFFHINAGPKLDYNGKGDPDQFASLWQSYSQMARTGHPKTVMISVGGSTSDSWNHAENHEDKCAHLLADFITKYDFAGVDFNCEQPGKSEVVAEIAVILRELLPDKIVTIAPVYVNVFDQVVLQVKAVNRVASKIGKKWNDILSWINAQFYSFGDGKPDPTKDPVNAYRSLLGDLGEDCPAITPDRLVLGVPLLQEDFSGTFNPGECNRATDAASRLRGEYPEFAGAFVWSWEDTRYPSDLNWAWAMERALGR